MIKLRSVFFCSDFKYMWICVCMFVAKHCSSQHPITSVNRFYAACFYLCLTLFFITIFPLFTTFNFSLHHFLLVSKDISVHQCSFELACTGVAGCLYSDRHVSA